MSTRAPLAFDVVPDELAQQLRGSSHDRRGWAKPLLEGKMLRMTKRPQWTREDVRKTGKKIRTRTTGEQTNEVFVWLEDAEGEHQPESLEGQLVSALG